MSKSMIVPTVRMRDGRLELIDQTRLPSEYTVIRLATVDDVCEAIVALRVRGAPALGVAGAYGLLVAIEERWGDGSGYFHSAVPDENESPVDRIDAFPDDVAIEDVVAHLEASGRQLAATRPTAVNLGWAIERMAGLYRRPWGCASELLAALLREADAIHLEDLDMCRTLGAHGAALIENDARVVTHCNTGGLATSGFGTALGVVFAAVASGKRVRVFADETRPLLQGARLTAWECQRNDIPVTILVEGAAASLMAQGDVSCAIVGADRIAANGDTANKIGTLPLAIVANRYGVPFYVAAPSSTIDTSLTTGAEIPIEQRPGQEVTTFAGKITAPVGVDAFNPAFDVTPGELIAAIITEKGVLRPPYDLAL